MRTLSLEAAWIVGLSWCWLSLFCVCQQESGSMLFVWLLLFVEIYFLSCFFFKWDEPQKFVLFANTFHKSTKNTGSRHTQHHRKQMQASSLLPTLPTNKKDTCQKCRAYHVYPTEHATDATYATNTHATDDTGSMVCY